MTDKGMVHAHCLLRINEQLNRPYVDNDYLYWERHLRCLLSRHAFAVQITKGDKNRLIRLNYLHRVDQQRWSTYMTKEKEFSRWPKYSSANFIFSSKCNGKKDS